ncbi:tetratricopeptide repeat protein [Haladaptatus sp. DYSN1]|uniref:tetratricopeptide repeat protein n=1 Tax=unclassified Haladaptatus TaxID=2622732 RepID=UPI0024074AE9|nr:tetratricopeptide repeat protein [Haladaptatus sp. DYSN1]
MASNRKHRYSDSRGFGDPYEGFTLDPPELREDPTKVDPVDDYALADLLDDWNVKRDDITPQELIDLGLTYLQFGFHPEAADAFERAARLADEDSIVAQEAWVNKGVAHSQIEEFDEAIGAFREALRIHDHNEFAALAEMNLAFALWEDGNSSEPLEHAERAVELDSRLPQAWFNLGFFYTERALWEDAAECFEKAITLGYRTATVYEEQARALEALGNYVDAETAAEAAATIRAEGQKRLLTE